MMKEELAAQLNGNQYGNEISVELLSIARESGLVIVYGASDDSMEFKGAISDEVGFTAYVTREGMFDESVCECDCKYMQAARDKATKIKAIWGKGDYSWQYETAIPHATFEIYEDESKYCKGIVFRLEDVPE